jgi:hypothetical protein
LLGRRRGVITAARCLILKLYSGKQKTAKLQLGVYFLESGFF